MTTQYETKEQALEMGLFYAGFGDRKLREAKLAELMESSPEKSEIGWPHDEEIELYEFKSPGGIDVKIGIGKFRSGFDLWFIDPDTGFSRRM